MRVVTPSRRAECRGRGRGRVLAVGGALLLGLTGCGSDPATSAPEPGTSPAGVSEETDLERFPEASTFNDISEAVPDPAPDEPTSGAVLRVKQTLAVHEEPDGPVFARLPAKQMESDTWVPVIEERDGWAQVLLPSRPNGSTGWVATGDDEPVEKAQSPYEVEVDVDERTLEVRQGDEEVGTWTVGVGAPESPTPRGRTYIMAAIEDNVIDYSPIVLPLGAHSDTYSTYGGGPGTVAFHGWPDADEFGEDSSDGCVRVPEEALDLLRDLPLGTTVMLR